MCHEWQQASGMRRYPRVYAARGKVGDLVRENLGTLRYFPTPLLGPYLQSALSSALHTPCSPHPLWQRPRKLPACKLTLRRRICAQ